MAKRGKKRGKKAGRRAIRSGPMVGPKISKAKLKRRHAASKGKIPLDILERRLCKLATVVASRRHAMR